MMENFNIKPFDDCLISRLLHEYTWQNLKIKRGREFMLRYQILKTKDKDKDQIWKEAWKGRLYV